MPNHEPAPSHGAFAAIPTRLQGVQFRSRLEARWAAFFTLLGWEWHYEPFDLEGYIPDFVLPFSKHGGDDTLVEVKPFVHVGDPLVLASAQRIVGTSWGTRNAVIVGAAPAINADGTFHIGAFTMMGPTNEHGEVAPALDESAFINLCNGTAKPLGEHYCLDRVMGAWSCALCKAHKNAWHNLEAVPRVVRMWIEAGNQVQWRSPR